MSTFKTLKRSTAALVLGGVFAVSGLAQADGTLAGTNVNNTANITFSELALGAGAVPIPIASNTVTFVVDEKVDLQVVTTGGIQNVTPGGPGAAMTRYQVGLDMINEGNKTDTYSYTIAARGDDQFDIDGAVELYFDTNGDGLFTLGVDQLLATFDGTNSTVSGLLTVPTTDPAGLDTNLPDALSSQPLNTPATGGPAPGDDLAAFRANGTAGLILVAAADAAVPGTATDAQVSRYTVTATSVVSDATQEAAAINLFTPVAAGATPPATTLSTADADGNDVSAEEVVITDGVDNETDQGVVGPGGTAIPAATALTAVEDGTDADVVTFQVAAADNALTKSVAVLCDPKNGYSADAYQIPGAYVRYTLRVENTGSAPALMQVMQDNLSDNLVYEPNFIDGGTGADGEVCTTDDDLATGAAANQGIRVVFNGTTTFYQAIGGAVAPDPTAGFAFQAGSNGRAFGETLTFLLLSPTGPLALNRTPAFQAAPPLPAAPNLPGQLNPGEFFTVEFNARVR